MKAPITGTPRPHKARPRARPATRALARFGRTHNRFFVSLGLGAFTAVIVGQVPLVGGALAIFALGIGAVIGLFRELEQSLSRIGDDDAERRAQHRGGQNKR